MFRAETGFVVPRLLSCGWTWGLLGLFLAVPILMVVKSVRAPLAALHPIATLPEGMTWIVRSDAALHGWRPRS
jgi:hypothetical protein